MYRSLRDRTLVLLGHSVSPNLIFTILKHCARGG
jgi:hypothetical protein